MPTRPVLRALTARLIPPLAPLWVAVALGLAEVSAMIDWDASRELVRHAPPTTRAVAFTASLLAWTLTCRAPVRNALLGADLAFARRSAWSDVHWAATLAAVGAACALPWWALWARLTDLPTGVALACVAAPVVTSGVPRRPWTSLFGLTACAIAPFLTDLSTALALAPTAALTLPQWRDRTDVDEPPARSATPPRHALAALAWRDLVAVARLTPGALYEAALVVVAAALAARVLDANGPTRGDTAWFDGPATSLTVLLGLFPAADLAARAGRVVGVDAPRLPFTPAQVVAAHVAACGVPAALIAVEVALWGPAPHGAARAVAMAFGAACCGFATVVRSARVRQETLGPTLLAAVALGGVALQTDLIAIAGPIVLGAAALVTQVRALAAARAGPTLNPAHPPGRP